MKKKHFAEVLCIKSGEGFIEGHLYAVGDAWNNSLYVLGCDECGNPINYPVHCYGEDILESPEQHDDGPVFKEF